ncbi:venom metalloproteinase BumaMPs1-like [Rhipicephalus microplus]|uniref:venom metalloproteinase BumaMPs1-like n=1 Tax=Rhipicephalus microplus TaxID=6941 RepID=UPI003F6BF3DB
MMLRIIIFSALVMSSRGLPQPRLVYPRLLEERAADGRMVMHLHDKLTLNLRKASVAARNFRVLEHEDGREVTRFFDGRDLDRNLHEDEKQFATVHVTRTDDGVEVEGVVGPHHRIEPMRTMERSENGLIPHMIHEIEKKELVDIEKAIPLKGDSTVNERANVGQYVPAEVIVEIFMVSDWLHHKHFNTTIELIFYLCVMINSVNIRYADTKQPTVKFLLTGVHKDRFSTYKKGTSTQMDGSLTLENFRKYAHNKKYEYGDPDMVFLITGYILYSTEKDGTKNTNLLGIAFVGGLCTDHFVGLGEDTAGLYSGMHTLAHEAAHVLGASHDGSPPKPWIPGDPGSLTCPWKDGHIMSYVDGGTRHHQFSSCSLRQIQNVLILRGEICWLVSKTNQGHTEPGIFPGMEVAPNEFCRSVFPNQKNVTADMNSDRMKDCMVKCQYPEVTKYCYGYRCDYYTVTKSVHEHALDYMYCAVGKVCVRGVCKSSGGSLPQRPTTRSTTTTTKRTTTTTTTAADRTTECRCDCSSSGYPPRPPTPTQRYRWPGLIRRY